MNETQFGSSREDLSARSTVFARDLFEAKTVVVTGAGGGLGLAIAALFAKLGANLAINGRNEEKLASAKEFLESLGAKVFAMPMTIRDPEQVEDFVAAVNQEFGSIDVLVNNAGGQFPQAALDFSPKGWNAVIDTNLNGTWWMMQSTARHWVAQKQSGSIVNIVAPGCCESTGFGNYPAEGAATFQDSNPMRHAGDEWDVAEGVVYLAANSGKFVTGEVLNIDGGQQMWGDPWPTGRPDYFRIS